MELFKNFANLPAELEQEGLISRAASELTISNFIVNLDWKTFFNFGLIIKSTVGVFLMRQLVSNSALGSFPSPRFLSFSKKVIPDFDC